MPDVRSICRSVAKAIEARIKSLDEERAELFRQKRELREWMDELTPTMSTSASQSFRAASAALEEGKEQSK